MVFRIALAFAALAVVDNAFLHPEQGTAAADHLASGLVPVAVAAMLAWAYPRLGPVVRGFTAIACGLLALTAGIADGFRHVAVDRLAGDDVTAMLAGLAGVVLVGLGAVTLWRERRLGCPGAPSSRNERATAAPSTISTLPRSRATTSET